MEQEQLKAELKSKTNYKMNNRKVYISGEIVPEADAKISIFDSAVLLGDTVY